MKGFVAKEGTQIMDPHSGTQQERRRGGLWWAGLLMLVLVGGGALVRMVWVHEGENHATSKTPVDFKNSFTGTRFSAVTMEAGLTDRNNLGCDLVALPDLLRVFQQGRFVSQGEVHDYYSLVGCTVKGSGNKDGKQVGWTFDYGGLVFFDDSTILACGEECCRGEFAYCSWDPEGLRAE